MATPINLAARQECSTEGLDCDGDGKLLIQAWNEAIDGSPAFLLFASTLTTLLLPVFNSICSNPNINSPLSFTVPELEPPSTTLAATYSASTTTNVDAYGAATAAPPSVFTSAAGVNSDDDDIHPADEDVADECSLELKEILQPAPREPSPGSGTTLPPSRGAGRVILPTSSTTPGPAQTPARALLTVTFITDGAPPTTGSASRSSGTPQAQATVVTGDEPETVADSDTTYTPTLRLTPTPASMVVVSTITSSGLTSTVLTTIVRTLPADPGSGEMVQIASSRVERPLRPNTRPAVAETPMEDSAISQRRSGSSATSASVPTAGTKLDSDESDASRGRYSISRISSPVAVAFLFIILHALS
ncbi:hypothetical protein CC1G_05674 [Coprinopsis cinerea okayama7|uniref:Uncharacterized protein n=1 Tax=Coprinopsis cinerea (strain Okayama-7 / 130 / ATCC MYA-4618 / FGSC 9003) TaxID=240176 RepID=A8N9U7_COPC7|nr:hypothetical protein CC1G_05674 [Coprinopsis cinerea okayama7\|eukprot:XP_001831603.2 hypothetical protein CC1G_05674 [Coprinopsis cinerea okayama7\